MTKEFETHRWVFIGPSLIPLLYERHRVIKQWINEAKFDPNMVFQMVKVRKLEENVQAKVKGYVS